MAFPCWGTYCSTCHTVRLRSTGPLVCRGGEGIDPHRPRVIEVLDAIDSPYAKREA